MMPSRRSLYGATAIAVALLSLITLIASPGHGAQVQLAWNASTNTDGQSLTELVGYRLYYGLSSGNYHVILDVGNALSAALDGLEDGRTYYFAVTIYDIEGFESDFSNEVSTTTRLPGSPGTFTPEIQVTVAKARHRCGGLRAAWRAENVRRDPLWDSALRGGESRALARAGRELLPTGRGRHS